MHNRDKYPEIWAAKEAAEAELAPLLAERKVHTDAMADVQVSIAKLKGKKEALNGEAMKDFNRISELRETIARMAKAMGAKTASGQ